MTGKADHYNNFDWIRLLLAVQVVGIHAGVAKTVFVNPVPAFMTVSGFMVLGSLERRRTSDFFRSRALRVGPPLLVSFLAVGLLFGVDELLSTVRYWLWPFGSPPINAVVWSLFYEELYYIVLAILVSVGVYHQRCAPIILFAIFALALWVLAADGIRENGVFLGAAFFIGNAAYIFRETIRKIPPVVAVVALVAIAALNFCVPYKTIERPDWFLLDYLSFASILAFCIAGPQLPRLTVDLSYSLYLFHVIVRQLLLPHVPLGYSMLLVDLAATLPICILCWYLIEKPALRLKDRKPKTFEQTAPAE